MEIPVLLRTVALFVVPTLCLSQSFTLSGYVIDGLTNQSLPGIRVHLYEWLYSDSAPGSHGPAAAPVTSDSEGHFSFAGLSRGEYVLQAELPHEVHTYGESFDPLRRNAIHVAAEPEGQLVLFRILPRATIRGFVRDEYGDIVEYAGVDLYRRGRRGGRIELIWAGSTGLDFEGRYTFADLWPGDYLACAEPPGPSPREFAPSGASEVEYHPGSESRVYAESCYPEFHILSGERRNLDLKLLSAPSVALKTKVGVALYRANLPRLAPALWSDNNDTENDRWQIRNVPPGSYILYALTGSGERWSLEDPGSVVRLPLVVESQPLALELSPEKRGRIEVHLQPSDGRNLVEGPAVSFLQFSEPAGVRLSGMKAPYTFDPGDYWISIRPKPPFCAISQMLTGASLQNGKITVTPGMSARLDVELGTNCGAVDVRAVSNGDAVPFASFLLLVNGTPQEPGDVVTGSMDAHGHASIPRLPPGRYRLWSWVPSGDGYLGPDLASAMARAVEVIVDAGRHTSVSVDPIRSPGVSR